LTQFGYTLTMKNCLRGVYVFFNLKKKNLKMGSFVSFPLVLNTLWWSLAENDTIEARMVYIPCRLSHWGNAFSCRGKVFVKKLLFKGMKILKSNFYFSRERFDSYTTLSQQPLTWWWTPVCGAHPHVRGCCVVVVMVL